MGQSNVTMTQAIANVRSLIDEPNAAFWSNTELGLWLNEACIDMARRGEILRQRASLSMTANQQDVTWPTDHLRTYRVLFIPTGQTTLSYPLEFRGYLGMDSIWGNLESLPSAWPEFYTFWFSPVGAGATGGPTQLTARIFPVPSQAGTLQVQYYRSAISAAVSPGTDTLDTLPSYEDLAYNYCVYRAFQKDADPRWQEWRALYLDQLVELVSMTHPDWTDQPDYISTGYGGIPSWLLGSDWS